ncbi:RSC complex subunit Rsc7 [Fusarium albosuccineum]|uniref:RSC complex subunit Rsc7 n=1 Tax=Fusarium albosuccineum TaxID=1237068 RepID=A0A8H4L7M9_9HYPO|nr:RSC complex subunit Rsc7 [Fusarium albosuccineum]
MDDQLFPEQGAKNATQPASSQIHEQEPKRQSQPSAYIEMDPKSTPNTGADNLNMDLAGLYQNSRQLEARRPLVQLPDMKQLAPIARGSGLHVKAKGFWGEPRLRLCIRYFGDNIIQATANEQWIESTVLFHSLRFINRNIIAALETFMEELTRKLPQMDELLRALPINGRQRIADFLRQLAEYIRTVWQKAYLNSEAQQRELMDDTKNTAPSEVIETLYAAGLKDADPDNSQSKQERTGHSSSRTTSHFLFKGPEFSNFCSDLRKRLYDTASPILAHTEAKVLGSLRPLDSDVPEADLFTKPYKELSYSLSIETDWKPVDFLAAQYGSSPVWIGSITQQCLWISSSLRLAPEADQSRRLYCNGLISTKMPGPIRLHISCQFEEILGGEESCWLELVDQSAVLCRYFPIPSRNDEKGLEIPLQIACGLTGIKHAVEFDGGIVMKAPSAMLVPISRKNDIVQWHFIANLDENTRFTYQEGLSQCQERATIELVDFEALQITRAIVGWCNHARKVVGRQEANYADIDYSTASPVSSSLKFSGGSIGIQQFAVTQVDFSLGPKDSKVPFRRSGNLGKILRLAKRQHLVLHDTGDKRAWLVNADDVILHVIQTSIVKNQHHRQMQLQYQDSAAETLRSHQTHPVSDDGETVSDMVMSTWSILEMLLDQMVQSNKSPDRPVKWPRQKTVTGFEFMGIVEERSPLDKVEFNMEDNSGNWTRLIKDTSTLVLFATGLKDLITTEDSDTSVCNAWRMMPKGKNYLGTTVPVLMDFYATAGSGQTLQHLTRGGLYWSSGPEMQTWEPGSPKGSFICNTMDQFHLCQMTTHFPSGSKKQGERVEDSRSQKNVRHEDAPGSLIKSFK